MFVESSAFLFIPYDDFVYGFMADIKPFPNPQLVGNLFRAPIHFQASDHQLDLLFGES
jgi:hypothetical protein